MLSLSLADSLVGERMRENEKDAVLYATFVMLCCLFNGVFFIVCNSSVPGT